MLMRAAQAARRAWTVAALGLHAWSAHTPLPSLELRRQTEAADRGRGRAGGPPGNTDLRSLAWYRSGII